MTPRPFIVSLLNVAMETTAGFTVVLAVGILGLTGLGDSSYWLFLITAWCGSAVMAAVHSFKLPDRLERVAIVAPALVLAAALALAFARTLEPRAAIALLVLLAYWRGASIAVEQADLLETQRRFGYGVALLLLGLILMTARGVIHQAALWHPLAILGIGYMVLSMTALGLARAESRREPGAGFAVTIAVAVQLAIVLVLSFGALLLLTNDLAAPLGVLLGPVGNAIGNVLAAIAYVIFIPLTWLFNLIHAHAHGHGNLPSISPPATPGPLGRKRLHSHQAPPLPAEVAGIFFVLLLLAGAIALVWRLVPRFPGRDERVEARVERTWLTPAEIWALVRGWLRALFRGSAGQTVSVAQGVRRRLLGPKYPRDPVRRLYARLLYRTARAGLARAEGTTPSEFGRLLAARWPDITSEITGLTAAYERRRYAEETISSEEIGRLDVEWQRIRHVVRPVGRYNWGPLASGERLTTESRRIHG